MRKVVNMSVFFVVAVLLVVLAVASVSAAPLLQDVPGEGEIEIEPGTGAGETAAADAPAEADPSGTAVRIDFELAPGHAAKRGHYSVQVAGGAEVASWYALDGWLDSGWIDNLDIASETVLVRVLYYPGPETEPTVMRILNPAPGTDQGWLGRGMAHALEVAWPDMPLEGEMEMVDENL